MAAIGLLILKKGIEDPPPHEPFQGVFSPLAYILKTALISWAPWLHSNPVVVFVIKKIKIIRIITNSPPCISGYSSPYGLHLQASRIFIFLSSTCRMQATSFSVSSIQLASSAWMLV